jgi:hypothetical protein
MDNVVRYEGMVSFKKDKFDVLLTINENSLLFQKKGLFNKKYKVVKEIVIKDIKVLKDVALVEYNNGKMTIHTMNDVFEFFVKDEETANKITNLIRETLGLTFMKMVEKTGETLMNGIKEVADHAKELVKEVVESAPVASTGEAIKEGTKVLKAKFNEVMETINNEK